MGRRPQNVPLGGSRVLVPTLVGPVGLPQSAYPRINQPAATAQVDAELERIAELRNAPVGAGGVTPKDLALANAIASWRTDRVGAIAAFQRLANVGTATERAQKIILPNGSAWEALFGYGQMARELDSARDRVKNPKDYVYSGKFDHAAFAREGSARLLAGPRTATKFNTASLPNFDRMLSFMESDGRIIDIRWMAYMFATAYWEAAETFIAGYRKNGKPIKQWRTVIPIDETGKGGQRAYARPVKVEQLGPTRARITEWDGDQFEVTEAGYVLPKGTDGGAKYAPLAHKIYTDAKGDERTYYGRGYVQPTWWYNYAAAGVAIGRGLDLLWNPELAKDPDIAYKVMADGMMTGRHYANTKRLQNYIYGMTTNYAGARAIVNAGNLEPTIVDAAEAFEAALLVARR